MHAERESRPHATTTTRSRNARPFDAGRAFDDHASALLGFAVNALRDRHVAEDCLQEIFLRAWRARERFDSDRATERTWLFAIARNVIADALRARARMPRIGGEDELQNLRSADADPLERLRIVEALARLSSAHREAVVAVHLHGRSYQELADATGVPVATWRTRAFHALRAMRGYLEGTEEPDAHAR
ncbi:sigma-70 family RNA polymerase sigma factor [Microbacterium aoyamense]|uniref:Sigma-70 family RNA polymerase sigma factor n=1 Tax=Microbacterium aoyamense TaxID=344166 RepID=A0ABN2P9E5_9MICO|nr:sigma-70 family RNA polymerase sigma factor [Microbacterium aoyamense]